MNFKEFEDGGNRQLSEDVILIVNGNIATIIRY